MSDERRQGSLKLGSNIEPKVDAPLDAREVVPTVAALTAAGTFPYFYIGLKVTAQDTGQVFVLVADDPTDAASWRELGGGGAAIALKAGKGIKIEPARNARGEMEYTISLDMKLESESDQLTIKEIES